VVVVLSVCFRMLVILSFCHLSACQCISCHSVAACLLSFILHAFLSIQLLLSVFFHSAVVCHPIFCYAADACHFTFCHATVTFPFVIQLLVTSSFGHPATFHSSVIHMFVAFSFCHSAACHLLILLLSRLPSSISP
jgi:hypothetical protein